VEFGDEIWDLNRPYVNSSFGSRLDVPQKLEFFTLSITSIFRLMYEAVNVGKKITNYTV
jgi:hypothetical protein